MYTIGYDFEDKLISLAGLQFSIRMFTEKNVYSPHPDFLKIEKNNDYISLKSTKLSWAGNQQKDEGVIELSIKRHSEERYIIQAYGKHKNELCKSILIQVYGINIDSIKFDQNKISDFKRNNNIKAKQYPKDIKMPLIFVKDKDDYVWFALSKDSQLQPKAFASHYDPFVQTRVLDLSHEKDKRFRTNEITLPEWHIGTCQSSKSIIEERCDDLEKNFGLVPFKNRTDTPEWLKNIKLIINLHGEHWTGHVFNNFSEMEEILEWVANRIDGEHVLAFLPGWDGRYYYNYPLYQPSHKMGGEKGLKRLTERAHQLNIKIIPMLGANNANNEIMSDLGMSDVAIKDSWGDEQWCNWVDWDYDLFKENHSMLANIGHPKFLNYMIKKSNDIVEKFKFDGLFLDLSGFYENTPDYSPYEGLVEWAKKIKKSNPNLLLFGEYSYDVLWGIFSMFHENGHPAAHGSSLYRYALQTHYLAYPAPGLGSGGVHEHAWSLDSSNWENETRELVPTLSFVGSTIKQNQRAAEHIIEKAKTWHPIYPDIY